MHEVNIMSQFKQMQFTKKDILYILQIILSAFIYTIGISVFAKSGNLFPGGFGGIARLISLILENYLHIEVSFSVIYFLLNAIVTILVFKRNIGPKFVLYSVIWYTLASILTAVIQLPTITEDILLIAVFGGLINGTAIGIALRSNASSAGTDFLAIDLSRRLNKPAWNYIFVLNIIMLTIAGYLFGWNTALYSMIFQFVSTRVVRTMHNRYTSARIMIVTDKADDLAEEIFKVCNHGITKIPCEGSYSHMKHDLLMLTINTYQLKDVENCIKKVDPRAFMTVDNVQEVVGNYVQQPLE